MCGFEREETTRGGETYRSNKNEDIVKSEAFGDPQSGINSQNQKNHGQRKENKIDYEITIATHLWVDIVGCRP